jgi:hypothetical protein
MSLAPVEEWIEEQKWPRLLGDREWPWLLTPLLVGFVVVVAYLFTHPYPAYGAGLYLRMSELIVENGYRLPTHVPGYTDGGVPFAYPPLLFYLGALAMDVGGVDPLALARYVPAAVTVGYLVPYYFLARELLGDRVEASLATTLLAVAPPALQWHLSAGGFVRGSAFLLAVTGCFAGVRLFRSGDLRWLAAGTLLFGLTVLAHPVYTVFFGVSYLLFYAAFDRTLRGLVLGTVVAGGGLLLAAPWWLQVLGTHGPDAFTAAAGTHSGLFGGLHRLVDQFGYTLVSGPPVPVFFALAYVGVAYFLRERRYLLPAWLVVPAIVLGKERFQFAAGAMMAAVVLRHGLRTAARRRFPSGEWRRGARFALVGVVLVVASVGTLYASAALPWAHAGEPSQPQFVDDDDRSAMAWVGTETPPDAEFVVLGDAAEWFPLFADRTVLVGPWGVEWTSPERYETQLSLYRIVSTCDSERCLTAALSSHGVDPAYVYVPKGEYTVRGLEESGTASLRRSLARSRTYELAFENEGVAVFRQTGHLPPPGASLPDGRGRPTGPVPDSAPQ